VVATNDQYVSVGEIRTMYRAARAGDKRLVALSAGFDRWRGVELLTDPATRRFTAAAARSSPFSPRTAGSPGSRNG
jgi:hypothetical protein